MPPIRTGVVGVGHLGYHHTRIYHELDESELAGVVDTKAEHRDRVTKDFGVPAYETVADLVAQGVQAVSVAVPTSAHHAVATELIAANVDVLIEKPIAASVEEAQDIVDQADARGCIVQVGHIERFNGAVIALFEAIKRPRFIECHRLSPYPNRNFDVSVVHDLMIHDLEIVLKLERSPLKSIDAVGVAVFSPSEDIANVRLRFESGAVVNLTASRVSLEQMRKIRIFEENAYVSTNYSAQEVLVYRKKPEPLPPGASPMEAITVEQLEVKKEEPLRLELIHFLECVRERRQPVVSGHDGLRALHLAEDIVDFIRKQP